MDDRQALNAILILFRQMQGMKLPWIHQITGNQLQPDSALRPASPLDALALPA